MKELTLIAMPELDSYGCQCLEHDIAVQSKTVKGLMGSFQRALKYHLIRGTNLDDPLREIPPAPAYYSRCLKDAVKITPSIQVDHADGSTYNITLYMY